MVKFNIIKFNIIKRTLSSLVYYRKLVTLHTHSDITGITDYIFYYKPFDTFNIHNSIFKYTDVKEIKLSKTDGVDIYLESTTK